ncbi:hypothetical protein [Pantoea sp. SOD02]|uniref:hypothetical protein n=1 Tax=Pantoea sp. SOD02 TaxID=2970818 RepID=UPI002157F3DC|nr:hypothetical protein [Pantoea sp. SOD02]UVC31910.1 hypothetical protein NR302_20280 [Pantoea sp. SOD02]
MARIHIKEIQNYLAAQGEKDALPHVNNGEGYFLEIRFDDQTKNGSHGIDEELRNKVITADCPYGMVTIIFGDDGQLISLDLS